MTLCLEHDREDGDGQQPYLVNLIDSPGHVDFSSEANEIMGSWSVSGGLGSLYIKCNPHDIIYSTIQIDIKHMIFSICVDCRWVTKTEMCKYNMLISMFNNILLNTV